MEIEVKQAVTEMQKLWNDMKTANDAADVATKARAGEINEKWEKMNGRLDTIETKLSRPAIGSPTEEDAKRNTEVKAAFLAFCRKGKEGCTPEQLKALTMSDDTAAGYLAPKEFVKEIIKGIVEFSPFRALARVRETSMRAIQIPARTGTFAASWVAETATRSETTGLAYGLEEVPSHEMFALVDVSEQMLEDSAFNLESELNMEFAEQFGVAEATAFIGGNGVGKPEGILDTGNGVATTNTGSAAALTADGLIDLFYAIKDAYAKNSTWLMRRASIGAVRKLKDSQNQYLWQPGLGGGQPSLLLGRPVVEAVDMPAIAASALPVAFGDFKRGYTILDRVQLSMLRDPFTQAASGKIRFIARKRVGGQVTLAEALRTHTCSV